MGSVKIYIDDTIRLSGRLEDKLTDAHVQFEYLPLSSQIELWNQIEILLLHSYLPDESLQKMKRCRYVGIRALRTDYVNTQLAAAMGIRVEGVKKQYGVNAVAEHTFALLFGLARSLVNADMNVKTGKWRDGLGPCFELGGKTLGIIGFGKIGKRVSEIGRSLGMKVLISGKGRTKDEVALDELLQKSDVISLHISGTAENRNFLNRDRISRIKDGAVLINTTRGLVADYAALEDALKSGKLSALGLDVFPEEPVGHHPICGYKNVLCTPHVAFNTNEAIDKLNEEMITNVLEFQGTMST